MIPRNSLSLIAVAALISLAGPACYAQAPAQGKQQWKDGEYAVYEPISKETQPAKRLELLNVWKEKFPSSDYDALRRQLYLQTYSQVLTAAYSPQAQPDAATKAAQDALANLDDLFSKKPEQVSDADWAAAKKSLQLMAQNIPGYVAWQRKDLATAQAEFMKSLQTDPNQGQVSLWLWSVIGAQRKPETYALGLYEYARAVYYDGPGALDAATRAKIKPDFENIYGKYHGSSEGLDALQAQVKTAALPGDYKILSKADIAHNAAVAQEAKDEELRKSNPMLALWTSIKTALTAADGATYFDSSMKGAALPGGAGGVKEFKGTLIEAKPAVRPKELTLAIADGKTPDVLLKLDAPLAGKMEPGAEIGFQGVASAYTTNPFLVTFDVEKAKISGWKGAPAAPAKRPVRRGTRSRSGD